MKKIIETQRAPGAIGNVKVTHYGEDIAISGDLEE